MKISLLYIFSSNQSAKIDLILTTMMSELSKHLNEQLGVSLNVKQQKRS